MRLADKKFIKRIRKMFYREKDQLKTAKMNKINLKKKFFIIIIV